MRKRFSVLREVNGHDIAAELTAFLTAMNVAGKRTTPKDCTILRAGDVYELDENHTLVRAALALKILEPAKPEAVKFAQYRVNGHVSMGKRQNFSLVSGTAESHGHSHTVSHGAVIEADSQDAGIKKLIEAGALELVE